MPSSEWKPNCNEHRDPAGKTHGNVTDALARGMVVFADDNRSDFYELELASGCFYIHIYDTSQTVYLLARFSPASAAIKVERPPLPAWFSVPA